MRIKDITESLFTERRKPTKKECEAPGKKSAFDQANCKNRGWMARRTSRKFRLDGKVQSVNGKKVKGGGKLTKSGGGDGTRIPDYTKASRSKKRS